jgi:hypothetical protein
MHRKRRMLPPIFVAVLAMVAGIVVAASPAASGASSGVHGQPFHITFRGTSPPLKQIAAAQTAARRQAAGGDIATELEVLHEHAAQRSEEEGGEPTVTGWAIPHGPNAAISDAADGLSASWQGANHFDGRYSDNGNQFSGEPPDQGLCVGHGYVMETVNSVVQIYKEDGTPLLHGQNGAGTGPVGLSLNQVLDYPPTFVRPSGPFGPFVFDVSCYYDRASHRWFHLIDDLEQDPVTGAFTGNGGLDLAVSTGPNPLGSWNLYFFATQNDGTDGTPNHHCDLGPCFADYPHIGADANGIYLTTNEYSFFGSDYNGVQLYALSKADLAAGAHDVTTMYYPNLTVPELSQKAFTLRAAQSRVSSFVAAKGGVEYFLSSTAGDGSETGNTTGGSDRLVVWGLSDTSSLGSASPDPVLHHTIVKTIPYVLPPLALQKDGPTPLLKCINLGKKCVGDPRPFKQEGPYPLDAGDTRIMGSFLQHGVLWGTLDTALKGTGGSGWSVDNQFAPEPLHQKAGVAYFAIRPDWGYRGLHATVKTQGYVGAKDANLTFPSIAVGRSDHAVMGATLVGPDTYPSAVYLHLSLSDAPSTAYVAGKGKGPDDGFTGTFEGGFRPRWGDYGYAVPGTNGSVWFAAEYIAQRCSFPTFINDTTCGGRRSFFANWSTRISHVQT